MANFFKKVITAGLASTGGHRRLNNPNCNSDICATVTTGTLAGTHMSTPCQVNAQGCKLSKSPDIEDTSDSRRRLPADAGTRRCDQDNEYGCVVESTVTPGGGWDQDLFLPASSHVPGFVNNMGQTKVSLSTDNVLTVTATAGLEYKHDEHQCKLVGYLTVDDGEHTSSTFKTSVSCGDKCRNGVSTEIPSPLEHKPTASDTKNFQIQFDLRHLRQDADNQYLSYYDRRSIGKLRINSNFELQCKDPSNQLLNVTYPLQTEREQQRRLGERNLVSVSTIPLDYIIRFQDPGKCDYDRVTSGVLDLPSPVFVRKSHAEYLTEFTPKSVVDFTNIRYPEGQFTNFTTSTCRPDGGRFKLTCEWADVTHQERMSDFSDWFSENDADVASSSPASGKHEQAYSSPQQPEGCYEGVCMSLSATANAPFTAKLGFEVPLTKTYYVAKPRMVCTDSADIPAVEDQDSGAPTNRTAAKTAGLYLQKELVVSYSAEPITQDTVVKQRFKSDFGDAYCADTDDCEADDSDPIAKVFQASKGASDAFSRQKVTLLQPVAVIEDFIDLTADKFTRYGQTSWQCKKLPHVSSVSASSCDDLLLDGANTDSTTNFNDATATLIGTAFTLAGTAESTLQGSYDAWTASTHVHVPEDYEIEFFGYKIALVDRNGVALPAVNVDPDIHFRERSSSVRLALTVSSDGTQLTWGGSDADKSEQFDGKDEAWESPEDSGEELGNNKGLFLVDTCRFCLSSYEAVRFDNYDGFSEGYAYDDTTGYEFFSDPSGDSNFNMAIAHDAAHTSSVCAQKKDESGYDASSIMCYSKTNKGDSYDPIFDKTHAYDCLDAEHIIKVSLRKSTGDDRVKEEFVEVFKTYTRAAHTLFQATGVVFEEPQAADISDVLNVEVGTRFDNAFKVLHPVTQAGVTAQNLEFSPTTEEDIIYTCGSSSDKQNKDYTKDYFHPCTDAAIPMTFTRPVRGLYSERQAQRVVSGGEGWKIREYDLERGTQTFSFQVAAPYADSGVDEDLIPVVTFNHGDSSSSQGASCARNNDDRTQTCSFTLSKQAIDQSHSLGVNEECGSGHAVACPIIEIELKANGITTPFSSAEDENQEPYTLSTGVDGEEENAFWDAGSTDGVCGRTAAVKLPITAGFDRKKTYTLTVTGNDNSYDQIITVSTRHGKMNEALNVASLARYVVHEDTDDQEFDATGEHDALDTLMSEQGSLPQRGNAYAHLRIEFDKDGSGESEYTIDVSSGDNSEFDAFVCSQQAFTSECVATSDKVRTIKLSQLEQTHLFVGVRKKKGSDVCENRFAGEDAFALGDNDHHFAFTIQKVGGGAQPHKYRVPMVCPSNGYQGEARVAPTLASFGGLRPSAESPAHRQVKSAKISGFVAETEEELFANGVLLGYERLPDGSIDYAVDDIYQEQMEGACAAGKFEVAFRMGTADVFATEDVACTDEEFGILRTVVGIGADAQILEEGGLVPNHLLATDGAEFSLALQIVGDNDFAETPCEDGDMWVEQGIGAPGFVSSPASAFQRAGASECAAIPLTKFKLHAADDGERCRFALITLSNPKPSASAAVPRFVKFRVQCPRVDDADESRLTDKLQLNYGIESALLGAESLQIELAPQGIGVASVTARFGNEDTDACSTRAQMESEGVCNLDDAIGKQLVIDRVTSEVLQDIVNCGGTFSEDDSGAKKQLAVNVDVQRQQERVAGVFGQKFYCGLAKLAFVYETTATTSTVITVENPKDKVFAVGIDDLAYESCGESGGYRLAATILVQHGDHVDLLGPAGAEVQRGAVTKFGWAGEDDKPALTDIDGGNFKITGACQPKPETATTCPAYENTRMIGFSLSMRVNEVVYTGRAALEMRLDCPINQDVALNGDETAEVAEFTSEQLTTRVVCPTSGSTLGLSGDDCANSALIAADSNILIIAAPTVPEAAMFDHTFDEPTIDIGNTGSAVKVSTLTDEFRAVVEGGVKEDFVSNRNRELRLRALPLAGTSATITWTVTRDAPKPRARQLLTISYALGADGSVEKSTKIGVLPAVRTSEQDSAITYTEESETTYSDGSKDSYNKTVTTNKPSESGSGLSMTAIIIASVAAAGAVVAVILVVACKPKVVQPVDQGYKTVPSLPAPSMDWARDRFRPDFL